MSLNKTEPLKKIFLHKKIEILLKIRIIKLI